MVSGCVGIIQGKSYKPVNSLSPARLFVCSNEAFVDRLGIKPEVRISHSPLCEGEILWLYNRTNLRQRKMG